MSSLDSELAQPDCSVHFWIKFQGEAYSSWNLLGAWSSGSEIGEAFVGFNPSETVQWSLQKFDFPSPSRFYSMLWVVLAFWIPKSREHSFWAIQDRLRRSRQPRLLWWFRTLLMDATSIAMQSFLCWHWLSCWHLGSCQKSDAHSLELTFWAADANRCNCPARLRSPGIGGLPCVSQLIERSGDDSSFWSRRSYCWIMELLLSVLSHRPSYLMTLADFWSS